MLALAYTDGLAADIALSYDSAAQDALKITQLTRERIPFFEELLQIGGLRSHIRHIILHLGKCQEKNAFKMNANDLMPQHGLRRGCFAMPNSSFPMLTYYVT